MESRTSNYRARDWRAGCECNRAGLCFRCQAADEIERLNDVDAKQASTLQIAADMGQENLRVMDERDELRLALASACTLLRRWRKRESDLIEPGTGEDWRLFSETGTHAGFWEKKFKLRGLPAAVPENEPAVAAIPNAGPLATDLLERIHSEKARDNNCVSLPLARARWIVEALSKAENLTAPAQPPYAVTKPMALLLIEHHRQQGCSDEWLADRLLGIVPPTQGLLPQHVAALTKGAV
jgi:hypothetical protein